MLLPLSQGPSGSLEAGALSFTQALFHLPSGGASISPKRERRMSMRGHSITFAACFTASCKTRAYAGGRGPLQSSFLAPFLLCGSGELAQLLPLRANDP